MLNNLLRIQLIDEQIKNNLNLADKIRARKSLGTRDSTRYAYALLIEILRILHPEISDAELETSITDAEFDADMDIIYIPKDYTKEIEIFDVKGTQRATYPELRSLTTNLISYVFGTTSTTALNKSVKSQLTKVRRRLQNQRVHIYVFRAEMTAKPNLKRFERQLNIYSTFKSFDALSKIDLAGAVISDDLQIKYVWKTNAVGGAILDKPINPKTVIFKVPTIKIVKLLEYYKSHGLNLFEKNVRDFKRNSNLSDEILQKINNTPKEFYIYNNGLVFVCDNISQPITGSFKIENPQIINGCQTVNTIYTAHFARKLSKKALKTSNIVCKICAIDDPKNIDKICQTSNTQIKITLDDLRSNDDVQRLIEKAVSAFNETYTRKISPGKAGITMKILAQWIYACKYERPADAKNKRAKLFDLNANPNIYNEIFGEDLKLNELKDLYEIGKFVKNKVSHRPKNKLFVKNADLHIMAAIYLLKKRATKKRTRINYNKKYKKIVSIIDKLIKKQQRTQSRKFNLNRMFTKKSSTWNNIKRQL